MVRSDPSDLHVLPVTSVYYGHMPWPGNQFQYPVTSVNTGEEVSWWFWAIHVARKHPDNVHDVDVTNIYVEKKHWWNWRSRYPHNPYPLITTGDRYWGTFLRSFTHPPVSVNPIQPPMPNDLFEIYQRRPSWVWWSGDHWGWKGIRKYTKFEYVFITVTVFVWVEEYAHYDYRLYAPYKPSNYVIQGVDPVEGVMFAQPR